MTPADELRDWIARNPGAPQRRVEVAQLLRGCEGMASAWQSFGRLGATVADVLAIAQRAYEEALRDVARAPGAQEAAALRDVRDKAAALLAALQGSERLRRPIAPIGDSGFVAWTDESAESLRADPDDLGVRLSLPDLLRELRAQCDRLMMQPKRQKGAVRDPAHDARAVFVIRAAARLQRRYGSRMPTALADLANALFSDDQRPLTGARVTKILGRSTPKKPKPR